MTDLPVLAVGAVVVNDGALLMVKRGKEPGKGLWSIPGGRVEHNELLSDALVREVKEETGLDIEVVELLGILEVSGDPHYVILDHVAVVAGDPSPTPGDDAEEVRWVRLEDVETFDCTPRFVESLRGWGIL
jgi:ADP-ribose pyrophosphatase YjhB (NUDIX family)